MRNIVLVVLLLPGLCFNTPTVEAARGNSGRDNRLAASPSNKMPAEPAFVEASQTALPPAIKTTLGNCSPIVVCRALSDPTEASLLRPAWYQNCHSLQAQHVLLRI